MAVRMCSCAISESPVLEIAGAEHTITTATQAHRQGAFHESNITAIGCGDKLRPRKKQRSSVLHAHSLSLCAAGHADPPGEGKALSSVVFACASGSNKPQISCTGNACFKTNASRGPAGLIIAFSEITREWTLRWCTSTCLQSHPGKLATWLPGPIPLPS